MISSNIQNSSTINRCFIYQIVFCIFLTTGCTKLVQVDPPYTSFSSGNVYTTDATAASVLTGIYTNMSLNNANGQGTFPGSFTSLSVYTSLSADELTLFDPTNANYSDYYRNSLSSVRIIVDFWKIIYSIIYTTNSAIEGIDGSNSLTPAVKQQLLGEAKFIRAYCYFYLVNLYGDVPLVLSSNYTINASLPRVPKSAVWQQIIKDLQESQNQLSPNYLDATLLNISGQRVRPNKYAAAALLARTYLYTGDWVDAEAEADSVISNVSLFGLASLNTTFLANNTEAIWQLQPVQSGLYSNTGDGQFFILPPEGPNTANNPVYLSNVLVNSFEPGDQRRFNWIDSVSPSPGLTYYFPFKYKIGYVDTLTLEYPTLLRLGEQFLIRSEARAEQGNISGSQDDLNAIRNRAGLPNIAANSQQDLLTAIMHERRVELFAEWGHRWFDLKRTATVDAVMGPGGACAAKGGVWNTDWQLYPLNELELQTDQHLVQNPGY